MKIWSLVFFLSLVIIQERLAKSAFNMASTMQKIANVLVGLATGAIFTYKSAPHILPDQLCRNLIEWKQVNREKIPQSVPVPERCQIQLQKVLKKLGREEDFPKIRLFMCNGYHPVSSGAVWLPNGAVIGLPKYFLFEKEIDVMASRLRFRNTVVNWDTKVGSQLRSSLVATDDNIAFLLGHELSHINSNHSVITVLLAPFWFYTTYKATFGNSKLLSKLLAKRSNVISFAAKLSFCCASYISYVMTARWLKFRQEFDADEKAANLDANMALGGVDYTLKKLKLNSALRVLYGIEGKNMYSKDGELLKNYTHPKLIDRLRALEDITAEKMGKIYQKQKN